MAPRGVGEWITQSSPVGVGSCRSQVPTAGRRKASSPGSSPPSKAAHHPKKRAGPCIHPLREREFFSLFRGIGGRPGWDADTPQACLYVRLSPAGTHTCIVLGDHGSCSDETGAAATCFWNNHVWVLGSWFLAEAEVCDTAITSTSKKRDNGG